MSSAAPRPDDDRNLHTIPARLTYYWGMPVVVRTSNRWRCAVLALVGCAAIGCGGGSKTQQTSPNVATTAAAPAGDVETPLPPPAYEADLPPTLRAVVSNRLTGDLDAMVARRLIRVGAPFNRTFYYVDKGAQRGIAYEMGKAFEDELNGSRKTDNTRIHVAFVPLPRDSLASALTEGKIDVVAAQVTVRPELQALVDFTNPTRTNVREIVVTAPGAPAIASVDDLAGHDVYTRKNSKYYQSLVALNERLKAQGKPAVVIREVPGNLEDDDLLEMVN